MTTLREQILDWSVQVAHEKKVFGTYSYGIGAMDMLDLLMPVISAAELTAKQVKNMQEVQNKALRSGFEEACENWDAVTEPSYIDFNLLIKALEELRAKVEEK